MEKQTCAAALWIFAFCIAGGGCDTWQPPPPTPEALDEGLVVMYPGSLNTIFEMEGFYNGLREAGLTQAIEVHQWAGFLEHMIIPMGTEERNKAAAQVEAGRLAEYKRNHPAGTLTLFSYSGGAAMCILVPAEMPPDYSVDRVVMMSPAVSRYRDLQPMLDRLLSRAVVYWSPQDQFTPGVAHTFGLADATFGDPAATYGFDTVHDKLFQVEWDPAWEAYANYGEHVDYVTSTYWIRDVVAPWVMGTAP